MAVFQGLLEIIWIICSRLIKQILETWGGRILTRRHVMEYGCDRYMCCVFSVMCDKQWNEKYIDNE